MSGQKQAVPEAVVKSTRAVLLSCIKGVPLKSFGRDYLSLLGERFPWCKLGYSDVEDLLRAMPDTVRFEYSDRDGGFRLYGIATKNMFTPSWVKKAQGNVNKPSETLPRNHLSRSSHRNTSSLIPTQVLQPTAGKSVTMTTHPWSHDTSGQSPGRTSESSRELVYNDQGLVTLHLTWSSIEHGSAIDALATPPISEEMVQKMRHLLLALISRLVKPVELVVQKRCHAFARFSLLPDARHVMLRLHEAEYQGLRLNCTPAREKMPQGTIKPAVKEKEPCKVNAKTKKLRTRVGRSQRRQRSTSSLGGVIKRSCDNDGPSRDQKLRIRHVDSYGWTDSDSSDVEWDLDLLDNPDRSMAVAPSNSYNGFTPEGPSPPSIQLSGSQSSNHWGYTPVKLATVSSPDQIWIQFAMSPDRDLEVLSDAISASDPDPLLVVELRVGVVCAVLASGCVYRRARVMDIIQAKFMRQPHTSLELIDCGSLMHKVPCDCLFKLPCSVSVGGLPPLAIPTAIGGVASTYDGGEWFPLDRQLLWEHLHNKTVYAKVLRKPSGKKVGVVNLYFDSRGRESVADLLIRNGLFLCPESQLPETPPISPKTLPIAPKTSSPEAISSQPTPSRIKSAPSNRNWGPSKPVSKPIEGVTAPSKEISTPSKILAVLSRDMPTPPSNEIPDPSRPSNKRASKLVSLVKHSLKLQEVSCDSGLHLETFAEHGVNPLSYEHSVFNPLRTGRVSERDCSEMPPLEYSSDDFWSDSDDFDLNDSRRLSFRNCLTSGYHSGEK